jgi:hypothetical protein
MAHAQEIQLQIRGTRIICLLFFFLVPFVVPDRV